MSWRGPLAVVLFAAAVSWLFAASLFGGKVLSPNDLNFFSSPFSAERPAALHQPSNPDLTDPVDIFDPQMLVARAAVQAGHLPLWDPYIGAGRPLLATQQPAPFFPLTWLALFTPFWHSLAWITALRLLLASVGMFAFCRALGLRWAPAVLGGLAFGLGTGPVAWGEHPHANVLAVMPWMFFFAERLWQRVRGIDAIGLALALGLGLLGGHPETFFVAIVGLAAFVAFRAVGHWRRQGGDGLGGRVVRFTIAATVGALLGAVIVIPLLELLAHADAASRNLIGPDPPGRLLSGLVFPEMFGAPDKIDFIRSKGTVADVFAGRAIYIGAIPLLLGLGGLAVRRGTVQLFFAVTGALAALGVVGAPGLGYLIRHLPVFSSVYAHWFLWLVIFSAAVLGAYGLDILIEADRATLKRMGIVMAAIAAAAVIGGLTQVHGFQWAAALGQLPVLRSRPPSAPAAALASVIRFGLLAAILAIVVTLLARSRARRVGIALAVLVALTAFDLLSIDHGFHPQVAMARANPPLPASIRLLRATAGSQRVIAEGSALHPDLAERYGLYDARSEDLPMADRSTALFKALGGVAAESIGVTLYDPLVPRARDLLNLFGVRYVFALGSRGLGADASLKPVIDKPGQVVLLNPTALPRAWIAYDWRPAGGFHDALRQTVAAAAAQLQRAPVIEGAPAAPAGRSLPATTATVSRQADAQVTLRADARQVGYLILNDTYYPGWNAEVNGRSTPILPANTAFRAVRIPAGRDTVVFRYQPESVAVGLVLTLVGLGATLLAALAAVVMHRRRGRR